MAQWLSEKARLMPFTVIGPFHQTSLQLYGWWRGDVKALSFLSVAYLVKSGVFHHRQAANVSERVRIGRECGCESMHDGCEEGLINHSLLALLLLSQESFQ